MPLGNPIRKQNESRMVSVLATEGQTVFTVQGGYIINHISVFRNGVRLSPAEDFTAGDGSTVTLNNAANIDDRIDFHIFDRFTVQNAIVGAASSQIISGDLTLTGKLFGELDVPSINTGIVTATNLNITGISTFGNVDFSNLDISGITTTGSLVSNGAISGTTGTFTGDVGIATANPAAKLHVLGTSKLFGQVTVGADNNVSPSSSGTGQLRVDGNGYTGYIALDETAMYVGHNASARDLRFQTDETDRLTIKPDGGVGISSGLNVTAGITTVQALQATTGTFTSNITCTNQVYINGTAPQVVFTDTNQDSDYTIKNDSGSLQFIDRTNSNAVRMYANTGGFGGDRLYIANDIVHTGDTNTAIKFPENDNISFETGGVERIRVANTGFIGIGSAIPEAPLTIRSSENILGILTSTDDGANFDIFDSSSKSRIRTISGRLHLYADMENAVADSTIRFFVDGTSNAAANILGGGQFIIGATNSASTDGGNTPRLQVSSSTSGIWGRGSFTSYTSGDQYAGGVILAKSRSGSVGNHTVVQDGDQLGTIWFEGSDGTDFERGAAIVGEVDGTPGDNDMPGALSFRTTPDGSNSLTERMRITSAGSVGINESSPLAKLHVKEGDSGVTALTTSADTLILEAAGNAGMTIATPNTNTGYLAFGDPEDNNVGMVVYRHGGSVPNSFGFFTSGSEHMRLDATGRLKITNNDEDINMSSDADGQLAIDGNGYIGAIALNDDAMQIYHNASARDIVFGTNEEERVRIKSTGHMGINNNNPEQELDIKAISSDATVKCTGAEGGDATIELFADEGDDNIDKWKINSSAAGGLRFQSYGTGAWSSALIIRGHETDSNQQVARFSNGTAAAPAISFIDDTDSGFYRYANNDIRFAIGGVFTAKFGDGFRVLTTAASIYNDNSTDAQGFQVDGSSGYTAIARDNGTPCFINRMNGDGNLISFYESGNNVGSISVSGNTVSYNDFFGAHKGRLSDGSKPTILPGTILENINQTIEWKPATISLSLIHI